MRKEEFCKCHANIMENTINTDMQIWATGASQAT
jgi:hypothetical protein